MNNHKFSRGWEIWFGSAKQSCEYYMSISYMGMGLFFFLVKMHHISKNRLYSSGHTASATPIATFYSYRHLSRKPLKTTCDPSCLSLSAPPLTVSVSHTHTHEKNETRLLLYTPIVTIVLRLISWAWLAHCNTRNNYLYWETVCGVDNLQVCYRWRSAANQDPACSGPQ